MVVFTVQRFNLLSSRKEAKKHAGRYGAREGAESSYILTHRQQEVVWDTGCDLSRYETSKPASTVTHFLQQDQTYSNKATPNNISPFGGHFLSKHHGLDVSTGLQSTLESWRTSEGMPSQKDRWTCQWGWGQAAKKHVLFCGLLLEAGAQIYCGSSWLRSH